MRSVALPWLLAVAASTGCVAGLKVPHVDEGGKFASRVGDPAVDRCAAQRDETLKLNCRREREQAMAFVRKVSVDDQICLEGNPMESGVTPRCKVRAFISDAGSGKLKLEIRETHGGSKFKPMQNLWYTEAALADAWLESAGYTLE
ncbi:MAG TPA: hypothetical protein VGK67_16030 [Myxococcales bacterium]|jgi:hypothetical protein